MAKIKRMEGFFGLAFDDVLLVPQHSAILPFQVDVSTQLTKRIKLSIPIISAAMDKVTESNLAIALAKMGGIGIIHKNKPIEAQAREVAKVKRVGPEMVPEPITIGPENTLGEARKKRDEFGITGFPVVDEHGKLVGMLTNRDIRNRPEDMKVKQVMTKENLITASQKTSAKKALEILEKYKKEKLPVVDSDGKLIGLFVLRDLQERRLFSPCVDRKGKLRVGASVGVADDYLNRASEMVDSGCDVLVIDSSHADSECVIEKTVKLREKFPDIDLIVGNVVTPEAVKMLCDLGVDAIKVGIGPGATCTTRKVTGCGVPQLTAILECANASSVPIIVDGGIRFSGDLTKALAAGASACMLGTLLGAAEESCADIVVIDGKKYKVVRGMGSLASMKEREAYDRYFQQKQVKFVPEGVDELKVPSRKLSEIIEELVGGLKSGMGLCGARNIKELQEKAVFIPITFAGANEGYQGGENGKSHYRP